MNYKDKIKNSMKYYNRGLQMYKQEKELEQEDIEEINQIIKRLKREISELYKELDLIEQTDIENYTRKYVLLRQKEDERRILIGERKGSYNAIRRVESKIEQIKLRKEKLVIC